MAVAPPTVLRGKPGRIAGCILAASLALAGFFVPQPVPLTWFPLDDPGDDIFYLELAAQTGQPGHLQVFCNTGRGYSEFHSISFPLAATTHPYTYTFPLPDAPIQELRLDPVAHGGTLTLRQFRVVDRRGAEKIRFTPEMFTPLQDIAAVTPVENGWEITSTAGAEDPYLRVELPYPLLADGLDARNLRRCLLSTGYLAGMLLLLLLAMYFAFERPAGWRDLTRPVGYLALLAIMFSFVGNRGLIRNSFRYARFAPPPAPPGLRLEFDLATTTPSVAQLFWDTGRGFNEAESQRIGYQGHTGLQTLRFDLPANLPLRALRFDPLEAGGTLQIRGLRLVGANYHTRAVLPLAAFRAGPHIEELTSTDDAVLIRTAPNHRDPILELTAETVARINAQLPTGAPPR